jgi:hypothetical protein
MRPSNTNVTKGIPEWTFVARQAAGRGSAAVRKVAVSELETHRRPREKNGGAAGIQEPQLATSLTKAFRSAVRRAKRANGHVAARA